MHISLCLGTGVRSFGRQDEESDLNHSNCHVLSDGCGSMAVSLADNVRAAWLRSS